MNNKTTQAQNSTEPRPKPRTRTSLMLTIPVGLHQTPICSDLLLGRHRYPLAFCGPIVGPTINEWGPHLTH